MVLIRTIDCYIGRCDVADIDSQDIVVGDGLSPPINGSDNGALGVNESLSYLCKRFPFVFRIGWERAPLFSDNFRDVRIRQARVLGHD